jgi:hypothetical protein
VLDPAVHQGLVLQLLHQLAHGFVGLLAELAGWIHDRQPDFDLILLGYFPRAAQSGSHSGPPWAASRVDGIDVQRPRQPRR